jgi:hypothetical protein
MNTHRFARLLLTAAAGVLAASFGACKHDTLTGPTLVATATPTPTPAPASESANIAGAWSGTATGNSTGCGSGSGTATLQQAGQNVTGSLAASGFACGFLTESFQGTVVGNDLNGTASGPDGNGTVKGTLSGAHLLLKVRGLDFDTDEVDLDLTR